MKIRGIGLFALWLSGASFQADPPPLRAIEVVSGLQAPIAFVQDPTDRAVFFAVEQSGRIRIVRGGRLEGDFLDLRSSVASGGERGLLGLALAPDFATSGRFFVNFTEPSGNTVVARFRRSAAVTADPASRFDLKWGARLSPVIPQPYSNHNGGHLAFGPDGYLYVGLGDGGSANDPEHRAQNPASLLGKMLRVDINVPDSHASGYVVPPDNPFADGAPIAALEEIWAFGLRNPWRFSFDDPALGGTGGMVIADVGQGSWEEIDYEPPNHGGRNYGWRNREGAHPNVQSLPAAFAPLVDPVFEYGHGVGGSITGGVVYRGRSLDPRFRGRYFFADYVSGRVWSLAVSVDAATGEASMADLRDHTSDLNGSAGVGSVSSFGVDAAGEMYLVSHNLGRVLKIVSEPLAPANLRIVR